MPLPFEQLPKESAKAFAAFCEYLNMGPQRSLAAVGKLLGKSQALMERWSAKFDWPGRVRAHEAHLATVERQATEALARGKSAEWLARQVEQRDEEWKARNEALELARLAIERWKGNRSRCGSLEGIARLLELASKLGRLASGMPTDRTEVVGEDGGPVRVEFEVALKRVYGEMAGAVVEAEVVPAGPAQLKEGA